VIYHLLLSENSVSLNIFQVLENTTNFFKLSKKGNGVEMPAL